MAGIGNKAVASYLSAKAGAAPVAPPTAPAVAPASGGTAVQQYLSGTLGSTTQAPTPAPAAPSTSTNQSTTSTPTTPPIDVGAVSAFGDSGGGGDSSTDDTPSPGNAVAATLPSTSGATPDTNAGSTGLSFAQVENFWIQAGGSPQAAAMAAAVSDAESGLNAAAQRTNPDGTSSVGLWLIPANGTPPGSTDPLANARAAVQLSQGGTDWSQWCSTWSDNNCGENGGTYLGSGANALMSLSTQSAGSSLNVFGAAPSGSGVGASTATSGGSGSSTTTSSSKLPILIGGLVIGVVAIVFLVNRKKRGQDTVQPPGTSATVDM
jgi:hypothetical protein